MWLYRYLRLLSFDIIAMWELDHADRHLHGVFGYAISTV
jgi:hypothetical protein